MLYACVRSCLLKICPEGYRIRNQIFDRPNPLLEPIEQFIVKNRVKQSSWELVELLNNPTVKFIHEFLEQCQHGIFRDVFYVKVEDGQDNQNKTEESNSEESSSFEERGCNKIPL